MKKMTALLAALLVFSLALPSMAAINLNGKVETQMRLEQNDANEWQVTGKTGVDVQTGFKAEGGQQVKAVVKLDGWRLNSFDSKGKPNGDFNGEYPGPGPEQALSISKVWLETDGAFWNGGPSVHTRLGDVDVKWNRLVGHLGAKRGLTVQGMELGPVQADAFYAFDGTTNPMGLAAKTNIAGLDLGATVVNRPGGIDMAANAEVEAIDGVRLDGHAALDADMHSLYRVNATVDTVPGMTLKAGYRANNDFAPTYSDIGHSDAAKNAYDEHTGFNVGVETEQAGIHLAADYDQPTATAVIKADTTIEKVDVWAQTKLENQAVKETKFGAKRSIPVAGMDIVGAYEGKIVASQPAEHVLKANTTINAIEQLRGLGVNAEVKMTGTDLTHWLAGATYEAPNGMDLGARYHSVDGALVTAGLKASF